MNMVHLAPAAHRFLSMLIFFFIPLSFLSPHAIVWEVILGGIMGMYYSRQQKLYELPHPIIITILAFPLWGLTTALWSKNPGDSLLLGLKILGLILLGLYWCRLLLSLSTSSRRRLLNMFMGGLCIGILFFIFEINLGEPWRYYWLKPSSKAYAQGSLILGLSCWPAILWALGRPYALALRLALVASLLIIIYWILLQIDCDTSPISLAMGIIVCIATLILPKVTSLSMRLFTPLLVIAFPLVSLYAFKPENIPTFNQYFHSASYIDRFYIWNEVATTIFEHPWLGIGMDGTRNHDKTKIIRKWSYVNEEGELKKNESAQFAMHPHNAILQLWLELGFMGVILGTLLTYMILYYIYRTNLTSLEKSIAAGLFTSAFIIDWFNVGFWQNWWISGLWIIIGLTLTLFKGKKEIHEGHLP